MRFGNTVARIALGASLVVASVFAAPTVSPALESEFSGKIHPQIERYCFDCHSAEKHKGDLDLERFSSAREVVAHPAAWEKLIEQVSLGEMPPAKKAQPSEAERAALLAWAGQALDEAALERAGDPGPVVLRRLNNAEFTYTVRDLTGIDSLDPAREFPADSAAGEGFMNTGNSLVMSPAMLTKYLDAAKGIASHAMLLPDGFRFSSKNTRRDWTDELLGQIRTFYARYTDSGGGAKVNLQGIVFDTNQGGRLPIEEYLRATIEDRAQLRAGGFESIAGARGLSPKYLKGLWRILNDPTPSVLLSPIRTEWRESHPDEAALLREIQAWQKALWKFSSVGHIGKAGGPKAWMEPVSPLTTNAVLQLKLASNGSRETVFYLAATDAGDGNDHDFVVWHQPRLLVPGRPPLLLRDARAFIDQAVARRKRVFESTASALAAVAEAEESEGEINFSELAGRHRVAVEDLKAWMNYLGAGAEAPLALDYLTNQIHGSSGYDFVNGWGTAATPLLVANSSDQHVRIPGNMKPHGVTVHPSPTRNVAVAWRSPMAGRAMVEAQITHAHPECGNGVEWFLELRRGKTRQRLAHGFAQGNATAKAGPFADVAIRKGDYLALVVGPRDGNHACDLTDLAFVIKDAVANHEWSLTRDVSSDVLAGNPHADALGNPAVWHFYTEEMSGAPTGPAIPQGSLLARWQSASDKAERGTMAQQLQELLLNGANGDGPDGVLCRQLSSLAGPLFAGFAPEAAQDASGGENWSVDPGLFGKLPDGAPINSASLAVRAPSVVEIRLPTELVGGAEFVTEGTLAPPIGAEGSVQLLVTTNKPNLTTGLITSATTVFSKSGPWTSDNRQISYDVPVVVNERSEARRRIENDFDLFREWFPPALCYVKIVPVDEVVTLTLFYREDDRLRRLMLDDAEKAQIDRLWSELRYVSQDALKLVDMFEQIWQFATQDADPKVFEPMRRPINEGAAAFRKLLADTEPKHIDALLAFANRAYRRPLAKGEQDELRSLYRGLRQKGLSHEEAFRATLSRLFVAPSFLYRLENAAPGAEPGPVTDYELASRLSYFLWSSTPDDRLLALAESGQLREPEVLAAETRRMLQDPRIRRLATEFACAWLHIHDFESLDEKSERHFPDFTRLRGSMYEEAIHFFTDLFQRDGSVLNILNSDYTFVNEDLAKFYGIPGVSGPEWRRVDGIRKYSRGGVLGFSAILAKESGASRTSPILRGNWLSETLLGEKLPRPPKGVPPLPADEATESLSVRQLVEKHSSDPKCYHCHRRIDGYGYALEGFDAIGRARTADLAGRPIDTRSTLFDGTAVDGFEALNQYLLTQKRDAVLQQFCRKLLGYSLGRGVILSDKPLIAEMQDRLRRNDYRFSAALEAIVQSRQFCQIRGKEMVDAD